MSLSPIFRYLVCNDVHIYTSVILYLFFGHYYFIFSAGCLTIKSYMLFLKLMGICGVRSGCVMMS